MAEKDSFYRKVSGMGTVFAEFDGHVVEYELQPGQKIVIDSGHLAAMTPSCQMDIQTIKGLKNVVFGGEGLFKYGGYRTRSSMASDDADQ